MRQEFFEKVLPSQGVYCAVAIPPGKDEKPIQRFVESIHELLDLTSDSEGVNVYVAPNTFDGYSRLSDHAQWARSFFVDLDVGDGKGYASKNDAYVALRHFAQDTGLPEPVIVDSGTGIHGYWPFMDDVPIDEWRIYAKKFKTFCIEKGLRIDAAITADAARIMRCPDTFNYKTNPPSPTCVLSNEIPQYDFAEFKEFLGVQINGHDVLAGVQKGLDESTKALLRTDNQQTVFQDLAVKSLADEGCAQIKFILEHADQVKYPLWMAGLSIAARCDDAAEAVHLMSEDHPKYDRDYTDFKAAETLKASGPHMCATFDEINPGHCTGCRFQGKLSPQSPLALARSIKLAPTSTNLIVQAANKTFPQSLSPYFRGDKGGIYYQPPPDGDEREPPILILPYDLYARKRIYNATDGDCLEMVYETPHDGERVFLLNAKDVYSLDKIAENVGKFGVSPDPGNMKHLMIYLIRWVRHMVGEKRAEAMRMQMGFTEDYNSFVIGSREYTIMGDVLPAPASPYVRSVAKLLEPVGKYEDWRRAADQLNLVGMELHAFAMLIAFGSPLMHLTSTSGGCISFYGTTGAAKTGALYGALSVYGDPKGLSVFDSTDNGGIQRMLALHNLPLGRDEASNMDPIALSNLIHNVSSGKAKIRLRSNINAERELELPASLIAMFTSNHSLQEKLQLKKASPEGEMARLIEFSFEEKPTLIANDPARAKEIFDTFRTCYGHAGPMYVKFIYQLGFDNIRVKIRFWSNRFLTVFGNNSAYRFYENIIAVAFAGAELANEAGIVNFDLDRIFNRVMVHVCSIKDSVRLNDLDYGSVVAEYIHKHAQNFLILDHDRVIQEPRGELKGRIEIHNQIQYVARKGFREHLGLSQISTKEFEHSAQLGKLLVKNTKFRMSSGWKAGMGTAPVWVYGFKADVAIDDLLKDSQADAATG